MDAKRNRAARFLGTLSASLLLCGCFASADIAPAVTITAAAPIVSSPTPTPLPGAWQIVATGSMLGQMAYSNGGATRTSEIVPVPAGPVYLVRDSKLLTVISNVDQLTLLKYEK